MDFLDYIKSYKDEKMKSNKQKGHRPKSVLKEALSSIKSNIKLKTSDINDKEIISSLELYAEATGISFDDAKKQLTSKVKEIQSNVINSKYHKNVVDNAAASAMFEMIQELDVSNIDLSKYGLNSNELLDRDYFYDLTQYVLGENAQFFPLKNPYENKAVKPYFYIYPDHAPLMVRPGLKEAAAHCTTAFCTTKAEMVFSRKFAESLSLYALTQGIKPSSKKYMCNGGDIPDHYCYLEFVIMHELLHYSAGDHFYTERMVKKIQKDYPTIAHYAHDILNYVGDYINNWQLVSSGYEQLPIGLFSEELNYDKFDTYEEIINVVADEMLKMAQEAPNDLESMMSTLLSQMDDHVDGDDSMPSQGGKNDVPTSQNNEKSSIDSDSSSDSSDSSSDVASAIDKAMKDNKKKVENRDDGNNDAETALNNNKVTNDSMKQRYGNFGSGSKVQFKEENATINWKKLLKRLIPSGDAEIEDTYSKMSRQATSSMITVMQTGTGRISPGEIFLDSNKRGLCFIIDNSGSVSQIVNSFNQEIIQLLKKNKSALSNFYVIKFSDDFTLFKVDVKKFKARQVKNPQTFASKKPKPTFGQEVDARKLFEFADDAGTQYTPEMHRVIEYLHKQMINMIMFTDDDLIYDPNTVKFYKLATKRKNSLAMFITEQRCYERMVKKYGNYKWVTVLK